MDRTVLLDADRAWDQLPPVGSKTRQKTKHKHELSDNYAVLDIRRLRQSDDRSRTAS